MKLLSVGLLFLVLALLSEEAAAEYRAFRLGIKDPQGSVTRQILTTLDPIQYPDYHPLARGESVEMLDTWMCWERSDGLTPICPKPGNPSESSPPP